jgi:hypothetical protein
MITICLRYGHIICSFGVRIVEILGRAVNVCGSTVDIFRRILPGIRHFGRGLLPRRSQTLRLPRKSVLPLPQRFKARRPRQEVRQHCAA